MQEWIPVPGSTRARLLDAAVDAFCAHGFDGVNVVELAAQCDVTTGALYHHFDSKVGLYGVVRDEMERRIVDRMRGAAAGTALGDDISRGAAVRTALLVGFDAALKFNACRLLSEPDPRDDRSEDPLVALLTELLGGAPRAAPMLAAVWRQALAEAAAADADDRPEVRRALQAVLPRRLD